VLASFAHDMLGRRTTLTRGNGTVTSYAYDAASRLSQLTQDAAGGAHDLTLNFAYNPAGQITQNTRSNGLFSVTPAAGVQESAVNGLNQLTALNGIAAVYDALGNMASDGTSAFTYTSENLMTAGAGASLSYDPLGRLAQVSASSVTRFAHDGENLVAEHDGANALSAATSTPAASSSWSMTAPAPRAAAIFTPTSAAASWRRATAAEPSSPSTATTNTASRRAAIPGGSNIPVKPGSLRSASITTVLASTTRASGASCRPIPLATATG
jgi:YD repeat-containing protein